MATKAGSRATVEPDVAVEADPNDQKAADSLEQMATVVARESDQKLLRTGLLEFLNHSRAGQKHLRREGELLDTTEDIIRDVAGSVGQEQRRISTAEIRDKDQRRKADIEEMEMRRAADERREEKAQERKGERHHEEILDRKAARLRKDERHRQDMKERETKRKVQWTRDVVLIGITVFCVLLSAFLIIFGVTHDKPIFVGGSGVSATIAIGGFARMVFGWGSDPSSPTANSSSG